MIAAGSLEYALARMQARLSRRPSEGAWAAIEEARSIVPILDAARGTSLEPMLQVLPPEADLAAVDHAARVAWSRTVAEATAWMPPEWSRATAWCDEGHPEDSTAAHPTLLPTLGKPEWRRRWPEGEGNAALDALARLFAGHLARFRRAEVHEATALRRAFEADLVATFRRHPVQAAAAFAWLAIAALDLERLRGEIERRLAFPEARIAA